MHVGSIAPDKEKESPKFTEVVTIMDHFILPHPAMLYQQGGKKTFPAEDGLNAICTTNRGPDSIYCECSSTKLSLRVQKATLLKQKDQSLNQLQPSFTVCLSLYKVYHWNVTVIYLIKHIILIFC